MDHITWIIIISIFSIPAYFIIWSFFSDPNQFQKALGARISLLFVNLTVIAKSIVTTILTGLYVIFDPIPIIIDDVGLIIFAIFLVKRMLKQIVKSAFPFPTP